MIPEHFGCLIFDRRTSRYLPFDHVTTRLLRRAHEVPIDRVISEAGEADRATARRFIDDFYDRGFFDVNGRLSATILDVDVPEDHLAGPLAVHVEIVSACNLTCSHCFAGVLPRRERPLTLEELDDLFAQMAALGSFRLGLTGGEPLLRHDIFDIIDCAVSHGLCPCLTTNGLLITEEIAREFGKRELVWLNVSLEGADAATNDAVRGEGSFDRVIKVLPILRDHARFTLAFTIMKTNAASVKACADLARHSGAHTAVFRPLYPVGIAKQNPELMPTFAEYNDALTALVDLEDEIGYDMHTIDPFSPYARQETQSIVHQNYGCGAGNLVCSISVSGDVSPCSFLGPAFTAANIRDTSLAEIWSHSQGFRGIRALSPDEPESTRGNTAGFTGGCRARALMLNGSINAPDPWIAAQVEQETEQHGCACERPVYNPLAVLDVRSIR
jgi:radical SAM protein with 4Fe4S-binding SPASM domain